MIEDEVEIEENPSTLRKKMLEENERSEKSGELFKPIYVDVGALMSFVDKYPNPKNIIVYGTNEGYVFDYKGKLYGAVSTGRIRTNAKGDERYIYKLERISAGLFSLGLAWINDTGYHLKEQIDKYDKRFHKYLTFEQQIERDKKEAENKRVRV